MLDRRFVLLGGLSTAAAATARASAKDATDLAALVKHLGEEGLPQMLGLATPGTDPMAFGQAFVAAARTGRSILVADGSFSLDVAPADVDTVLDALGRLILIGSLVINLPAGTYIRDRPVLYAVRGGDRLALRGAPEADRRIRRQVAAEGDRFAHRVTVALDDVAGIVAGDWLATRTTKGAGDHYAHRGVWRIEAVDPAARTVTVLHHHQAAAFPDNAVADSESAVLRTTLMFRGCEGLIVAASVLGELSGLVIAGDSDDYWSAADVVGTERAAYGILIGAQTDRSPRRKEEFNPLGVSGGHVSAGRYLGVSGFDQQGIVVENGGTFWGDFVACCNNKRRGFYVSTGAAMRAKHISACGNYLDGVICDIGGSLYASSTSAACGNGKVGVSATEASSLIWDDGIMTGNGDHGGQANGGAQLRAVGSISQGNAGSGYFANNGNLYCDKATATGNARYGLEVRDAGYARATQMRVGGNRRGGLAAGINALIRSNGTRLDDQPNPTALLAPNGIIADKD